MIKNIVVTFLLITTWSCNEVPVMIPDYEIPTTNRVVLIEELTGVRCPNCPKGGEAIKSLLNTFGDKVAVIGIHGSFLTMPLPESKFDFRNQKAKDLETFHSPFLGKPAALINRVWFDGQDYRAVDSPEQWLSYVESQLNKAQEMEIILNKKFDESTRSLSLDVTLAPLIDEEGGQYKISVFITEGGIVDPQETVGSIIEDYEHEHVLRDMLTSVAGDDIGNKLDKNKLISKSYSYSIPTDYHPEHMEAVVMISRNTTDDRSVIQAAKVKIK